MNNGTGSRSAARLQEATRRWQDSASAGMARAEPEHCPPGGPRVFAEVPLIFKLKKAVPRLWQKVEPHKLTRKDQRTRLGDLVEWMARKEGAQVLRHAPRRYPHGNRVVEGRVDMRIMLSASLPIEVEVCFELSQSAVLKLRAAKQAGAQCLLICGFAKTFDEALLKLSKAFPGQNWNWLVLSLLDA